MENGVYIYEIGSLARCLTHMGCLSTLTKLKGTYNDGVAHVIPLSYYVNLGTGSEAT